MPSIRLLARALVFISKMMQSDSKEYTDSKRCHNTQSNFILTCFNTTQNISFTGKTSYEHACLYCYGMAQEQQPRMARDEKRNF